MSSPVSANMEESTEEDPEMNSNEEEDADSTCIATPQKKTRNVVTGRGITLGMLLSDGIIEAGNGCLSMDYLGKKFYGDLLPDGKIRWQETKQIFNSPSAWAIYCKKVVNPAKKSGCGWASVKYKGKKLDQFKSTWFRKQHPELDFQLPSPGTPSSLTSSPVVEEDSKQEQCNTEDRENKENKNHYENDVRQIDQQKSPKQEQQQQQQQQQQQPQRSPRQEQPQKSPRHEQYARSPRLEHQHMVQQHQKSPVRRENGTAQHIGVEREMKIMKKQRGRPKKNSSASNNTPSESGTRGRKRKLMEDIISKGLHQNPSRHLLKSENRDRTIVNYTSLEKRTPEWDPNTLVKCAEFSSFGTTQPFTVTVTTNCLMLMDFHCHLTTSEVVGYLAGLWDPTSKSLQILKAFPCRCRLGDRESALIVEEEIRQKMESNGLSLVGWYHSHPACEPHPSIRDLECQMDYQMKLKSLGSLQNPCIGAIITPYNLGQPQKESTLRAFWVMTPQEHKSGIPMQIELKNQEDTYLSQDILNEMKWLSDYYRGSPDMIIFSEIWHQSNTFLDKLKGSLAKKFPKDQTDGRLLEFIHQLLL
ncbi:MPN domain-containing protein-like isoform X2 [Ptychodera flava]|uniref:MPN domain-containing protein-like isoform X2 n=1 Tax=Ptychodera flava TaxID=63121 RepID=UPI00396A4C88